MLKKFFGSAQPKRVHDIPGSSWGKNDDFNVSMVDPGVLRRLCTLLRRVELLGWFFVMVLATLVTLLVNYALHMRSFETIIFNDGTELVCVMQGRSGEVFAHDQFGRRIKTLLKVGAHSQ